MRKKLGMKKYEERMKNRFFTFWATIEIVFSTEVKLSSSCEVYVGLK